MTALPPAAQTDAPEQLHPWDIPQSNLLLALAQTHRPDLLAHLISTSRSSFGFFTKHFAHTVNYVWLLERLEALPPGALVLDVGAGVSPLPLILSARGHTVHTIDQSQIARQLPPEPDWNEWGFLDYGSIDPRIQSVNCTARQYSPPVLFDRIYSISVLAHMTRSDRADTITRARRWLRPGGRALFSIDLIPSSDFIWNRSEGVEVSPPERHGTIFDLRGEFDAAGFHLTEFQTARGLHETRTDLLFVEAVSVFK